MRHSLLFPLLLSAALLGPGCRSMYDGAPAGSARHLLSVVNSTGDDIAPVYIARDSLLVWTSNVPAAGADESIDHLLAVQRSGEDWTPVPVIGGAPDRVRTGGLAPGPRGEALLVQCYRPDGVGDCDLCTAALRTGGGGVSLDGIGMVADVNDKDWDHHPALSANGDTLVFASERYNGLGESDLWQCVRGSDGRWSAPANLGERVNAGTNDVSPFLTPDGRALIFASDRRGGRGGFDLYRSERLAGGGWGTPTLLGTPWNSPDDDLFYWATASGDTTFFSSNRSGGLGGFDIYMTVPSVAPPPPQPAAAPLVLRVVTKNAFTLQPIQAEITVTCADDPAAPAVQGRGRLDTPVRGAAYYTTTAWMQGYLGAVDSVIFTLDASGVQEHTLLLTPVSENERKIFSFTVEFDFNLFNIRPEERQKLDSAAVLLERYPNSVVVVSGHTDSLGTIEYNIRLGYSRATEVSSYVKSYLRDKNVVLRKALEVRTYGESEPVAPNATDEGRQRNRRVEIAIVRYE